MPNFAQKNGATDRTKQSKNTKLEQPATFSSIEDCSFGNTSGNSLSEMAQTIARIPSSVNQQQVFTQYVNQHGNSNQFAQTLARSVKEAQIQRIPIKKDNGIYYPQTHPTGVEVESDYLPKAERKKVNTNLAGNQVLAQIRAGWKSLADNYPIIQELLSEGKLDGAEAVNEAKRLYDASQDATTDLPTLLGAQRDWQNFLAEQGVSKKTILSHHRSFGFEYEFATWELINEDGEEVLSHTEVGKSANFSNLFGVPFILETDAQNELELVAPPLLAGEVNGGINKTFMSAVHTLFKNYLVGLRDESLNTAVNQLAFEDQLGSNWTWEPEAAQIQVASERKKWANKPNQIGYQLNVALTPKEIATQVKDGGEDGGNADHFRVYTTILNRFLRHAKFTGLHKDRKEAIRPAILLLAKGISNSIAIPTLSLVARTRKPWTRGDLHSYVKDLHGIWVKDSVPNVTVAAVSGDDLARGDLAILIGALEDIIPRDILTNIPTYTPQGVNNNQENRNLIGQIDQAQQGSTRLKLAAQEEAKACLKEVKERLQVSTPQAKSNTKPAFLGEQFGTGEGVRKDTYANIGSSNKSSLHLAELRSNKSTDDFLR